MYTFGSVHIVRGAVQRRPFYSMWKFELYDRLLLCWSLKKRKRFYLSNERLFVLVLVNNKDQFLDGEMDLVIKYIALSNCADLKHLFKHSPIL